MYKINHVKSLLRDRREITHMTAGGKILNACDLSKRFAMNVRNNGRVAELVFRVIFLTPSQENC